MAISSNGRMVVANGNTPVGDAGILGLWTFPTGNYLRGVAGDPEAISPDFRYLATELRVQDLETGKNIVRTPGPQYIFRHVPGEASNPAFSPDGNLVAAGTYGD